MSVEIDAARDYVIDTNDAAGGRCRFSPVRQLTDAQLSDVSRSKRADASELYAQTESGSPCDHLGQRDALFDSIDLELGAPDREEQIPRDEELCGRDQLDTDDQAEIEMEHERLLPIVGISILECGQHHAAEKATAHVDADVFVERASASGNAQSNGKAGRSHRALLGPTVPRNQRLREKHDGCAVPSQLDGQASAPTDTNRAAEVDERNDHEMDSQPIPSLGLTRLGLIYLGRYGLESLDDELDQLSTAVSSPTHPFDLAIVFEVES